MKVFLHGWGMRKEMFSSYIEAHHSEEDVMCLSLPGYDDECHLEDFDEQVVLLSELIPDGAHIVAWSLGGLFALRMAEIFPDKISRLTMICSTPLFVKKENWEFGLDDEILAQFSYNLKKNRGKTIAQFIFLQLHGQKNIKQMTQGLSEIIKDSPSPSLKTLQSGLKFLQNIDLRGGLKLIKTKVCFIFGGRDKVVLSAQCDELIKIGGHIEVHVIATAGHVPFITHKDDVFALL